MRLVLRTRRPLAIAAILVLGLAAFASTAGAVSLRSPQVPFNSAALQAYFTGVGEVINVNTAQADVQIWGVNIPGTSDFNLMLKNGAGDAIGVYNALLPGPPLFQVFPPAAQAGWYAVLHFGGGSLTVSLFDQFNTFQGQTNYAGVDPNNFGFYISPPAGGTFFSQDGRNANGPQVLTYQGVVAAGDWWLCFEDAPYNPASQFMSAILEIQSVHPTPTSSRSWGYLKSLYH